jgi:hypothetical protein
LPRQPQQLLPVDFRERRHPRPSRGLRVYAAFCAA